MITDEARAALIRLEAAYTDAAQRLQSVRREASETQTRAHELHVELLRLSSQAEAATTRRTQLEDELAEIDAQDEGLIERRMTGEARFEELDLQLADTQERQADLEEGVIQAERKLSDAREQLRALERRAQEAQFHTRALSARQGELQRAIETADQQVHTNTQAGEQLTLELDSFNDQAAGAGLQDALAIRATREAALAVTRTEYDDLSDAAAPGRRAAPRVRAQPAAVARRHHQAAAGRTGRAAGRRAIPGAARGGRGRPGVAGQGHRRRAASSCTACRPRSTASAATSTRWAR